MLGAREGEYIFAPHVCLTPFAQSLRQFDGRRIQVVGFAFQSGPELRGSTPNQHDCPDHNYSKLIEN